MGEADTKLYDVVQVEDDEDTRNFLMKALSRRGLTYHGVGALDKLETALNSRIYGEVYVVDGRFPRTNGNCVERLCGEAVQMIRLKNTHADIFLYSSESDIDKIAKKLMVDYRKKTACSAVELAEILKKRIDDKEITWRNM